MNEWMIKSVFHPIMAAQTNTIKCSLFHELMLMYNVLKLHASDWARAKFINTAYGYHMACS